MRPLGKSLEKTSVESEGKSSGEGPGPAGHWDSFGEFDIYSKIHWLDERIPVLFIPVLNIIFKVKSYAISNKELISNVNKEFLQVSVFFRRSKLDFCR